MKTRFTLIFILLFVLCESAFAYLYLYSKEYENSGYDFEFDPYYTSIDYYTAFGNECVQSLDTDKEKEIYAYLLKNAYQPKFMLLEMSVYPLPCAGVAIKKNYRDAYFRSNVFEDFNLIEAACSGYQEPYAYSLFLGNIVSFKPKGVKTDMQGKSYMGYLASIGDFHIKDSEIIDDKWFELEWKIKGDRFTEERLMKWSYRVGTKQHKNPYIKDVFYFSILRDRTDFNPEHKRFLDNATIEYTFDIDYNGNIARQYFIIGKSFPVKGKKYAFYLDFGVLWERWDKYTGPLERPGHKDIYSYMLRPNIKF